MITVLTIGNYTFPEDITIPETLKVPDGNVFKYCLYGVGVVEFKFNESDSTWSPTPKREAFFYNSPENFSSPSSIVATFSSTETDSSGEVREGVIKSVLPGDSSFIAGKALSIDYNPETKTINGVLAQIITRKGETFSDVTYVQGIVNLTRKLPTGSYPDGSICRIPVTSTHLYYKSSAEA